jgi:hypothetical protein
VSDCRRTPGLIEGLVADRVAADVRAHARGCPWCGPVLARASRFDETLRTSARSLVTVDLPAGILESSLTGRTPARVLPRRAAPSLASILVAIAILLTATVIALGPGSTPTPSPSSGPTASPATIRSPFAKLFRSTDAIVGGLAKARYGCNDGQVLASPGDAPDAVVRESAICTAPDSIGPFIAAVIVGESARGEVVEIAIKGDLVGSDTSEAQAAFADAVARVLVASTVDELTGQSAGSWARIHVVQLRLGDRVDVVIRDVSFHAQRTEQGYLITARRAGVG